MDERQILEVAADVVDREGKAVVALSAQLKPTLAQAAQTMLACSGNIIVSGSGTSHAVGLRFAHLLTCCGTPAFFLHPGDSQHGDAGIFRQEDVVVALSKGGETAELIFLARVAKERGATVIAITEQPASPLGRISDIVLQAQVSEGIDPYGLIAIGSSLLSSALCDALCVVLLNLRGYTLKQFGQTHPGGAVGRRLRETI